MLGLPKNTEISKQLPKKSVYAKFQMNAAAKEKIDADISKIIIVNEISPEKINIPAGAEISSFFVLHIVLKRKNFDDKTIITLSKLIPQNILFVLEYEKTSKLAVYRSKLIQTEWKPTELYNIELCGLSLDKVWENIVKNVELGMSNDKLSIWDDNLSLDENIEMHEKQEKIKKEISRLETQARNEKQPNKKFELVQKLNQMKKELEAIRNA